MGFRVVEQDEVDIAGIVQLGGAELAHAEHGEAAPLRGRGGIGQADLACVMRGAQEMRDREAERRLGQRGERARHPLELPDAADIGDRGRQRHLPLGLAQRGGDTVAARGGRGIGESGHGARHHGVGPARGQLAQARGLTQSEVGEIGAVAAEGAQHGAEPGLAREPCGGAAERGETFDQPLAGAGIGGVGPILRKGETGHSAARSARARAAVKGADAIRC